MQQLDTNLDNLISDLRVYVVKLEEAYKALQQRIKSRIADENDGKEPTVDNFGRFHAPCDGYIWDDVVYGGGQYLHLTNEQIEQMDYIREQLGLPLYSPREFAPTKIRLQATPEIGESLQEVLGATADVGFGKVWESGQCYLYITSKRQAVLDFIANYKEEQRKIRMEQLEAEAAARKAAKGKAPVGRQTVRGKIVKVKVQEGWAWNTYEVKMMVVLENGATVYGTCPASISATEGIELEFTATFENAEGDDTHSFFKRPTKAKEISSSEAAN